MSLKSTLRTVFRTSRLALAGQSLRDKKIAFLLAGLGVMGKDRKWAKDRLLRQINGHCKDDTLTLTLFRGQRTCTLAMRKSNSGDYLVGGEFIRGSYEIPSFVPRQIIDGGANIGTFSMHAASHFPSAELVCYEPDINNFRLLRHNLEVNGIRAALENKAIWPFGEVISFEPASSHTGKVAANGNGMQIPCGLPEVKEIAG